MMAEAGRWIIWTGRLPKFAAEVYILARKPFPGGGGGQVFVEGGKEGPDGQCWKFIQVSWLRVGNVS
jgi:hypothetical protein